MKILLAAHVFSPSIGGIESCSLELALAFAKLGHQVQVITQTPSNNPVDDHGITVIRRPNRAAVSRAIRWCDVYFQSNISLKTAWPMVFDRKPWVVCTHTWLRNSDGTTGLVGHAKKLALRFATNIYISEAIRDHVGHIGIVVPNPYNAETFRVIAGIKKERSLVFVGRLVSDKGCDLLIRSLKMMRISGLVIPLTIVGEGPEAEPLRTLVRKEQLDDVVAFAGFLRGEALAKELNRHQVLVVPSRWEEPFGMVALEGIACGCVVVGSAAGGLRDAIGPCGVTFRNGDLEDLSRAIREAIEKQNSGEDYRAKVSAHLKRHRAESVANHYLKIFERAYCENHKMAGSVAN